MTRQHDIFLLGGHDLEMIEIGIMARKAGYTVLDKNLTWNNANLSAYAAQLNEKDYFVGIELKEDITTPKNYFPIDHHNENSHKQSSIEQVAKMLGIELTRDQQLVAANDSRYIPGMIAMGATPEEIADIRLRDRKAQGVTELDEQLNQSKTISPLQTASPW